MLAGPASATWCPRIAGMPREAAAGRFSKTADRTQLCAER